MRKHTNLRLIPALITVAFSGAASASGFQLWEQNASGIGNAYAGSAAVAENASTIYFNPAGMTQLQSREVSFGITGVKTNFEFNNDGSRVGFLGTAGDGGNGGTWGAIPNAYLSWEVAKDWYLGLGLGAPFGLKTDYDTPWKGGAHSNSFEIKTYNINPSAAWRANEWLSLGAGFSWQKIEADYQKQTAVLSPVLAASKTKLEADDTAWNWNVGALFTVTPKTKVGVSYRSTTKYTLDGSLTTSGPSALINAATSSNAKADLKLPDTFILSIAHNLTDQWELLGDISWTGWGSVPYVDIVRTSGAQNGRVAQKLDTAFEDTWRFALGANYKVNDAWKIRMGIAYDQTPVPNAEHRLTSLPDNDRTWFSGGFQWKPNKTSALDVGLAYLYVKDANINNGQAPSPTSPAGLIKGTYNDSAWIMGAQYSLSF